MRRREHLFFKNLDWWSVAAYLILVFIGWISIFSAVYDPEHNHIFDTTQRYGMQMIWMFGAWLLAFVVLLIPARVCTVFKPPLYSGNIVAGCSTLPGCGAERLAFLAVTGTRTFSAGRNGKVFVSIGLAGVMSRPHFHIQSGKRYFASGFSCFAPMALIFWKKKQGWPLC